MAAMLIQTLQVAVGGAVGASLRFALGVALLRPGAAFPTGVLAANLLGSFAMGVLVVWLALRGGAAWQPLLLTGVLGGFTTFSAFALEAWTLWERGATGLAGAYVAASVAGSLAALGAGLWLARAVLA